MALRRSNTTFELRDRLLFFIDLAPGARLESQRFPVSIISLRKRSAHRRCGALSRCYLMPIAPSIALAFPIASANEGRPSTRPT
jgi:hypothetical protein